MWEQDRWGEVCASVREAHVYKHTHRTSAPATCAQVPWEQLKAVEMNPTRCSIQLKLDTGRTDAQRVVECGHPASMSMVYSTIRQAMNSS